jgi:branched-chain amino acid transport system substrate-binding protein
MLKRGGRGLCAVIVAVAAMTAAGCGGDSSSSSEKGPIKIGAIMTKTGSPFSFSAVGVEPMTREVFKEVNAAGGIHGRKIDWIVADDANTPQGTTQAARKLIQQENVVALVGGASYVSCATNASLYQQFKILAIESIAADSNCYRHPNTAATNPGPFVSQTLVLLYGVRQLHLDRQCVLMQAQPTTPYGKAANAQFEQLSGQKLAYTDMEIPASTADFTPYLLKAKARRCQSIFISGGAQQAPAVASQMKAQGMTDVALMTTGGTYDPQIAKALAKYGVDVYVPSEFEPFTEKSEANADWRATAQRAKAPLNTFNQGAYLAAHYIVDVLKGMSGPITRETVTEALRSMKPISSPMVGTPFVFGPGKTHTANQSVKILKLHGDAWQVVTPQFVDLGSTS